MKCINCKKKINKLKVFNFKKKLTEYKFFDCKNCIYSFSDLNRKVVYENNNINYSQSNDIFYFLKIIYFKLVYSKYVKSAKSILDYGCGSGELANSLINIKKRKIYATDIFTKKPKDLNKKIFYFKNEIIFKKKKKFDLIFVRHVLEHEANYFKTLKKLYKLLSKDGTIYIEVPNYSSFWKILMKSRWPGYFYPYHFHVFSKKILSEKVRKLKFKKISITSVESPVIGTFLMTFGINRKICKFISILFYPFQYFISKSFFRAESIKVICSKN